MNAGELIGIILGTATLVGGFIVWLTNWIKSLIKAEIERYDRKLQDARIQGLLEENNRLKEWAGKSK